MSNRKQSHHSHLNDHNYPVFSSQCVLCMDETFKLKPFSTTFFVQTSWNRNKTTTNKALVAEEETEKEEEE